MNISRDISISSLNTLFYDSDVVAMEMISVFDSIVDGYKYTVYTHTAQQTTINKNKIQNLRLMLPLLCTIIRQSTTRAFAVDTKLQQKCVFIYHSKQPRAAIACDGHGWHLKCAYIYRTKALRERITFGCYSNKKDIICLLKLCLPFVAFIICWNVEMRCTQKQCSTFKIQNGKCKSKQQTGMSLLLTLSPCFHRPSYSLLLFDEMSNQGHIISAAIGTCKTETAWLLGSVTRLFILQSIPSVAFCTIYFWSNH